VATRAAGAPKKDEGTQTEAWPGSKRREAGGHRGPGFGVAAAVGGVEVQL